MRPMSTESGFPSSAPASTRPRPRIEVRLAALPPGGWRAALARVAVALAIGAAATVATTLVPLWWHERGHEAVRTSIYRGDTGWVYASDAVFALRWANLQLLPERLLTPLDAGELPAWAEPPPPPYPDTDLLRVATLAVGWPMPVLRARWVAADYTHAFPVPAEVDEGDTSIVYAAEDLLHRNRAGGPGEVGVLGPGLALNLLFFAAVWSGPVRLLIRVVRHLRGGRVTRPAGAAAGR